MALQTKKCSHLEKFDATKRKVGKAYECEECMRTGDSWVHLRTFQECGITWCCDSSPNNHGSRHFASHRHPVVISAEPNESWAWCYTDKTFLKF